MADDYENMGSIYMDYIVEGKQPAQEYEGTVQTKVNEQIFRDLIAKISSFLFIENFELSPGGLYGNVQQFKFRSDMSYIGNDVIFVEITANKQLTIQEGFMQTYNRKLPLFADGKINFDNVEVSYKIPGKSEIEQVFFNSDVARV